jgi:hypothetical protein
VVGGASARHLVTNRTCDTGCDRLQLGLTSPATSAGTGRRATSAPVRGSGPGLRRVRNRRLHGLSRAECEGGRQRICDGRSGVLETSWRCRRRCLAYWPPFFLEPSPGADVARAQSRCRCGRSEPSPGADVAGVSPAWCRCGGLSSPAADAVGASPVQLQIGQRWAQSRCRCGMLQISGTEARSRSMSSSTPPVWSPSPGMAVLMHTHTAGPDADVAGR